MSGWDKNDPFDMVANIEGTLYEQAFSEGVSEAQLEDIREQGRIAGRLKGYAIGIELGFMESAIHATELCDNKSLVSKRVCKRRSELKDLASTIDNANSSDIDYEQTIRTMRALYKQSDVPAGPFISKTRIELSDESQAW